jgi:large subunit ribosomal protein L2
MLMVKKVYNCSSRNKGRYKVISNDVTDILLGNAMRIKNIPSGTIVHCVESKVGMGATFGRSAGQAIVVQGIDPTGKYVQIKMPSGEIGLFLQMQWQQ